MSDFNPEYVKQLQAELFAANGALAEANKKLAEQQAHIKVLEDALVNAVIPLRGIDMRNHSELAKAEVLNAIGKIDAALFTTCPTEALDKVVREAKVTEAMMWADWFESSPVANAFEYRDMFRRHAESLRRIEP